jgi:hypothetical protein
MGLALAASTVVAAVLQVALCWWLSLRQSSPTPYRTKSVGEWRVIYQSGWGHRAVTVVRDGQLLDAIGAAVARAMEEALTSQVSTSTPATSTRTFSMTIKVPTPGLDKVIAGGPPDPPRRDTAETPPRLPDWVPQARFPDAPTREAHAFGWPALALRYSAELDPRRATEAPVSSLRLRTPADPAARALEGCVPVGVLWGGLLLDTALIGIAMAAPLFCVPALKRRYRRARGRCPACGYERGVQHAQRCPECGS